MTVRSIFKRTSVQGNRASVSGPVRVNGDALRPDRMLKQCQPQGLPDRKAGNASACVRLAHPGRGHRPCHSASLILGPPGAQSPRPAPAPPPAGASRPPGRALASAGPIPAGLQGTVPSGRRKRGSRFLFPPKRTTAPPRFNGRGHRPCHSATLPLASREPKPPASARPAHGGRFSPAGSGAGLRSSRTCRSTRHRPTRAGETRVAFPDPARTDDSTLIASLAGAIAPATAPHCPTPAGGQGPRAVSAPPPAGAPSPPGRALACRCAGSLGLCRGIGQGRGKRAAFPDSTRKGNPFARIAKSLPAGTPPDCCFSTLVTTGCKRMVCLEGIRAA